MVGSACFELDEDWLKGRLNNLKTDEIDFFTEKVAVLMADGEFESIARESALMLLKDRRVKH